MMCCQGMVNGNRIIWLFIFMTSELRFHLLATGTNLFRLCGRADCLRQRSFLFAFISELFNATYGEDAAIKVLPDGTDDLPVVRAALPMNPLAWRHAASLVGILKKKDKGAQLKDRSTSRSNRRAGPALPPGVEQLLSAADQT